MSWIVQAAATPAPAAPAAPTPGSSGGGGGQTALHLATDIAKTAVHHWHFTLAFVLYLAAIIAWEKWRRAQRSHKIATNRRGHPSLNNIIGRYLTFVLREDTGKAVTKPKQIVRYTGWLTWRRLYLFLLGVIIAAHWTSVMPWKTALVLLAFFSVRRARKVFAQRKQIIKQMFDVAAATCKYPAGSDLAVARWIDVQKWEGLHRPGATNVNYPPGYDSENQKSREVFERQFNGTVSDEHTWTYKWESSKNRVICAPAPFLPKVANYPGDGNHPWNEFPIGFAGEGKEAVIDITFTPHVLIAGPTGSGKSLSLQTLVSTPTGWTTMGELKAGDVIFGLNGQRVRVVKAHPVQHGRPCRLVTFNDGTQVVADADHLWSTVDQKSRWRGDGTSEVRTTDLIAATLRRSGSSNHSIAVAGPLDYPGAPLPIDPYYLGYWLGDGRSYGAGIITEDPPVAARIHEAGYQTTPNGFTGKAECLNVTDGTHGGLVKLLRSYDLLKTAQLPRAGQTKTGPVECGPDDGPFVGTATAASMLGVVRGSVQNFTAWGLLPSRMDKHVRLYPERAVRALRAIRDAENAVAAGPGLLTVPEGLVQFDVGRDRLMCAMTSSGVLSVGARRTRGGSAQVYRETEMAAALAAYDQTQETKHVPTEYLVAGTAARRALLAGLMDSDGTVKANGRAVFTNTNETIARQTLELALGLGYQATLWSDIPYCNGKAGKRAWHVGFACSRDSTPFGLARKTAKLPAVRSSKSLNRFIVSVEPVPSVPVRCIEVDSPDRLFLITRNNVPTHNSVGQRMILLHALQSPDWRIVAVDPKRVELNFLRGLDNVLKVASNLEDGVEVCEDVEQEMTRRYTRMESEGVNHFTNLSPKPPALLLMIDETFAFLSPEGIKSDEGKARDELHARGAVLIGSIARLGRAAGIHLVLATQRPDATVLKGELKNNLDCRIAAGRMDTTPSLMVLDSEAATRLPQIRGRGLIRLGQDLTEFQGYWSPLEDLPGILAAAKVRRESGEEAGSSNTGRPGPTGLPVAAGGRFGGMKAKLAARSAKAAENDRAVASDTPVPVTPQTAADPADGAPAGGPSGGRLGRLGRRGTPATAMVPSGADTGADLAEPPLPFDNQDPDSENDSGGGGGGDGGGYGDRGMPDDIGMMDLGPGESGMGGFGSRPAGPPEDEQDSPEDIHARPAPKPAPWDREYDPVAAATPPPSGPPAGGNANGARPLPTRPPASGGLPTGPARKLPPRPGA